MSTHKYTNRLAGSTSPYLLQHAHNPVDWYPWREDALEKARREEKPIFLSVGYAACHWCHVLAHESFENEETAQFLNDHFVSIKVDREERPDLDEIYMLATQLMSGSGGWPMSVFLTPDLKPFFAGTYFPPEDRYGRIGFKRLLQQLADAWQHRRQEVIEAADRAARALQEYSSLQSEEGDLGPDLVPHSVEMMVRDFDAINGGFGGAPKFPPSMRLALMLHEYRRTREARLLKIVTITLDRMARGGIYDQVGGGFHRYSVDEIWLVPHFEKMLYDNALLAPVYLESFQITGCEYHARIGREVLDYVLREMTDPRGGFYSTLDADSEGHEGKFYLWTPAEVEAVLGAEHAAFFCRVYDVTPGGNFEAKNIPNLIARSVEEWATELKLEPAALWARLDGLRERLREARSHRVWPGLDDKVLTSWNGLMIRAMVAGYRVLGDERYRTAAERAADFVLTALRKEGRLLRSYRDGQAHLSAYLDDYAFMTVALLDLHEATGEARWREEALQLLETMNVQFWDPGAGEARLDPQGQGRGPVPGRLGGGADSAGGRAPGQGGYFFTAHDHETPITRMKSNEDGALPSGNSMAALALVRLGRLAQRSDYLEKAGRLLASYAVVMRRAPAAFANLLLAVALYQEARPESGRSVGADLVRITAQASAPAGRGARVQVELTIPEGWHINSHRPLQEYLRPTELRLEPGSPYRLGRVEYPEGEIIALAFSPEPLSAYQGTVTLAAEIEIDSPSAGHAIMIPLVVQYQACNDRECLAPVEIRVEAAVGGR